MLAPWLALAVVIGAWLCIAVLLRVALRWVQGAPLWPTCAAGLARMAEDSSLTPEQRRALMSAAWARSNVRPLRPRRSLPHLNSERLMP